MHRYVVRYALAVLAASAMVLMAGCGGSGGASPTVPSLSQGAAAAQGNGGQGTGGSGAARASALHAAAQCIRQHGIPGYAEPVLTPGGSFPGLRSACVSSVWQARRTAANTDCDAS